MSSPTLIRVRGQATATIMEYQGEWSSLTAYALNDVVSLTGTFYICILAHSNHTPPDITYWIALGSGGVGGATLGQVMAIQGVGL